MKDNKELFVFKQIVNNFGYIEEYTEKTVAKIIKLQNAISKYCQKDIDYNFLYWIHDYFLLPYINDSDYVQFIYNKLFNKKYPVDILLDDIVLENDYRRLIKQYFRENNITDATYAQVISRELKISGINMEMTY